MCAASYAGGLRHPDDADVGQELLDRLRQALDAAQGAEAEALRVAVALRYGGGTPQETAHAVNAYEVLRCERVRLLRELEGLQPSQGR